MPWGLFNSFVLSALTLASARPGPDVHLSSRRMDYQLPVHAYIHAADPAWSGNFFFCWLARLGQNKSYTDPRIWTHKLSETLVCCSICTQLDEQSVSRTLPPSSFCYGWGHVRSQQPKESAASVPRRTRSTGSACLSPRSLDSRGVHDDMHIGVCVCLCGISSAPSVRKQKK